VTDCELAYPVYCIHCRCNSLGIVHLYLDLYKFADISENILDADPNKQ